MFPLFLLSSGEQGAVKTIYKAEKKPEEICEETARWVNLLNGHNSGVSNNISPVPFRSQSPPRLMADRSSPVFSSSSSSSSSCSSYNSPFTYSSWSAADESSLYKYRAKRASPTPLSANAKEKSRLNARYWNTRDIYSQTVSRSVYNFICNILQERQSVDGVNCLEEETRSLWMTVSNWVWAVTNVRSKVIVSFGP